ncbi:MAG: hypothetical protein QOJ54_377 [Aliidongia sp.]|nr:hypothetical protein [Aliidongia sp.]
MRAPIEEEAAAVRVLAHRLGLGSVTPVLLKAAHHSIFRISPHPTVVRVQSAYPSAHALSVARLELAVARHLADLGAPTVAQADPAVAGPHLLGRCTITLWPYVDHGSRPERDDAAAAAQALRAIHQSLASFAGALPPFTESLAKCGRLLADPLGMPELSAEDRAFLQARFRQLTEKLDAIDIVSVPLHGDTHLGNILWTADGPLWGDLESVCTGPVEWDLSALPPTVRALFPEADTLLIDLLADIREVCVAVWCWAEPSRSSEVRSAAEYHLSRLRVPQAQS